MTQNNNDPDGAHQSTPPELMARTKYYKELYGQLAATVQATLETAIDKAKVESAVERVAESFLQEPYNELLIYTYLASKDNFLMAHITNNVILAAGFAASLNFKKEEIMEAGVCAFCHDLGMAKDMHVYDQNITPLSSDETKAMQQHPIKSAEMAKPFFSENIIRGIMEVHEFVNGQGYPNRKAGQEISSLAKMISLCDVFEALTHPRPFRKEFNPYEAMKIMIKKKDIIFDAKYLKKFVEFLSIYPIGTLVQLNSGETAMVIASNPGSSTRSVVRILLNARKEVESAYKTVNLLDDKMLYIIGTIEDKEEQEILQFLKPRGDFKA